ncbi:SEC-C metal-binding domain-containing protein [Pseudomonas oryzihabitans]|uniref:SEC-C metal-binding domain-containing protein n=1 Tax=Pseudomonas oryzihabitans TaxID=47885 RepID=UPI002894D8D5|nr:SEC-C metal-binding domain-containing protein [Pseudomonas oryzihabitans]MDT3722919.1 SEC-C metal-binding domain-containing protein [Pseudomonas oryzihabitans]
MQARSDKIGRNDLCPCGSKKKYKKCHGGVNSIPAPKPGQVDAQLRGLLPKAECLAPESFQHSCQGRIIDSHTVSRSGSLGEIAENGHVYSYNASIQRFQEMQGRLVPKLCGWKDASTFPGFCGHHDKQLFAPLEDAPFVGSQHQCFLLGYRSFAWEYYAKLRATKNNPYRTIQASRDPIMRSLIAQFNYMNELGLRDIQTHKETYDKVLTGEHWPDCHGLLIEFDQIFPIQCSAAWSPTEDINGNTIQELDSNPRLPETAAIVSFAADGKSYFLLLWLDDSARVSSTLARSIDALPREKVAGYIAALLLLTSENCHFSPSWYDSLSDAGKELVHDLAHPMNGIKPSAAESDLTDHIGHIGIASLRWF